jgi:hypothetical protein
MYDGDRSVWNFRQCATVSPVRYQYTLFMSSFRSCVRE